MCGNSRGRLRTAETGLDARAQLGRLFIDLADRVRRIPRISPRCSARASAIVRPEDCHNVVTTRRNCGGMAGYSEGCFASFGRFDPGGRADPKTAPHSVKVIAVNVSAAAPLIAPHEEPHCGNAKSRSGESDHSTDSDHMSPSRPPWALCSIQTSKLEEVLMRTTRNQVPMASCTAADLLGTHRPRPCVSQS
jgi:hypothetical protein